MTGVDVWIVDLHQPAALRAELEAALDPEERGRAARLPPGGPRDRFVVAHGALRELLGARLGAAPRSLELVRAPCPDCGGAHGRPELAGGSGGTALAGRPLRFSLSHSDDRALVAIGAGAPVGVDLERHRDDLDPLALAATAFTPAEAHALARRPDAERRAAFFGAWTRKEAYAKARGGGIARFGAFEVTLPPAPPRLRGFGSAGWVLRDLDVGPGWSAALATQGPAEVTLRAWRAGAAQAASSASASVCSAPIASATGA